MAMCPIDVTPAEAGVHRIWWIPAFAGMTLLLLCPLAKAHVEVGDMAKKLLYGDKYTRMDAIKEFNTLPPDAQYKLVPDFMVAMSDEDPDVRKIAGRILKAMGVRTEGQIPDAKNEVTPGQLKTGGQDKWSEELKLKEDNKDKWGDLKKMHQDDATPYADMKEQIEKEKNGQVTLDAAQLAKDSPDTASPLSSVTASLKDPDPWVRAQAARRLAMIHPAPMEAIPDLIKMLGDKEVESRRAAAAALGSFGHLAKQAIIPLNAALSDPDPAVKQIAADALKLIKQEP
jgi:HEAT repeat protein